MIQPQGKWAWRKGHRRWGVKAEVVGGCIENLMHKLQRDPEAKDLVTAARDPKHPLHGTIFNCDDSEAAEKFREHIARKLIDSLCLITVNVETSEEVEQIAFVNVRYTEETPDGENVKRSVYMPTSQAMETPEYRDYVIEDALRCARGFQKRVKQLSEFKEVCKAIDMAIAAYEAKKKARQNARKEEPVISAIG